MSDQDHVDDYAWKPADVGAFEASPAGESPALAAVNEDVVQQFRANAGAIVEGPFAGMRGLLLHTVGARSGAHRITPLYRFDFEERWYVIGADGGSATTPAWVINLRKTPQAYVEIGSPTGTGTAKYAVDVLELSEPWRSRIWDELRREIPHIDAFQENAQRVIPVFRFARVAADHVAPNTVET